jgi:hypothetical protein
MAIMIQKFKKGEFLKGDMGKQALTLIWVPFLQFLTYFNEIFSISFFFQGRLNSAVKSDLTPLHSAHFALQRTFCTVYPTFLFFKVES